VLSGRRRPAPVELNFSDWQWVQVGTITYVTPDRRDPSFMVRVHRSGTTAVISVSGVVDLATAPLLRAVLHDLLDDVPLLVADLSAVTLLDGHSVGMFVSTRRHAHKRGGDVLLRSPSARARRVLEITGTAKLCDPPEAELAPDPGDDRTVETLLRARQRPDLAAEHREGLRQLAIVAGSDLAVALGRSYRGRGEATEDLVQVAMVGLIKAVDGFEADRGPAFAAYAVPTIAGEIKRHFRDKGWTIRVPRRMQEIGVALPGARDVLGQRLNRAPTAGEVATYLGITTEEVLEAIEAAQVYRPGSLSAPIGGEGGDGVPVLGDVLGGPDHGFDLVDDRESLRSLISELPAREQRILALRFYGNLTQSQIAEKLGVSQMHVSRLLSGALAQLRQGLLTG